MSSRGVLSKVANIVGLASVGIIVFQLTHLNRVEFDYDKHGLKKGDYLLTLNTFEDPKKLGLVLVQNASKDGRSFKLIKNVPGEYVLDNSAQHFHRVPRGMLYVKGVDTSDEQDYVTHFIEVGVCFISGGLQALPTTRLPQCKVTVKLHIIEKSL